MGVKKVSEQLMVLDDSFVFYVAIVLGIVFLAAGLYMAAGIFIQDLLPQEMSGSPAPLIIAPFLIIISIILFVGAKHTTISLDKSRSVMSIKHSSLILGGAKSEYKLQKITKVVFAKSKSYCTETWLDIYIVFVLSDGSYLPFATMVREPREASTVAHFLGVPFEAKYSSFKQSVEMLKSVAEQLKRGKPPSKPLS